MFVDTDYYDNGLLRKLIPNFPPRIEIGFAYQSDIDAFDDAMDDWENADTNDPADFESEMYDFEAWMPEARGYWDTGYPPCVQIFSVDGESYDYFNYEEFVIGGRCLNPSFTRSTWLREVIDALSDEVLRWDWTEKDLYYPCDEEISTHTVVEDGASDAFEAPIEMLLFKHNFLDWYEEWVKQGRPVRTLDYKYSTLSPIIGEMEYERR